MTISAISLPPSTLPDLLRGLGRGPYQHAGRGHRDRRQDFAALLSEQGLERGDPHSLRLRGAATHRARPGQGEREINGKGSEETRFYSASLVMRAEAVGPMIRAHWAIGNSLPWVMDMVFRDDECRGQNRQRSGQFRNLPAYRLQSRPEGPGEGLN